MSNRKRGKLFQVVTALFSTLLAVMVLKWIYETGATTAVSRYVVERNSSQYAANAQERIEHECLKQEAASLVQCIREIVEATNEHQRSEDDLVAQGDMALWAFWMVVISAIGLVVTTIGVVYVAMTLREKPVSQPAPLLEPQPKPGWRSFKQNKPTR
jgi:succinate dehydrogenase hydrophobic anchor subunit